MSFFILPAFHPSFLSDAFYFFLDLILWLFLYFSSTLLVQFPFRSVLWSPCDLVFILKFWLFLSFFPEYSHFSHHSAWVHLCVRMCVLNFQFRCFFLSQMPWKALSVQSVVSQFSSAYSSLVESWTEGACSLAVCLNLIFCVLREVFACRWRLLVLLHVTDKA